MPEQLTAQELLRQLKDTIKREHPEHSLNRRNALDHLDHTEGWLNELDRAKSPSRR